MTIDEAIIGLQRELACVHADMEKLRHREAAIVGEITGLERAREMFGVPEPPAPKPERHSVQRAVMQHLKDASAVEGSIVTGTGLPADSVHNFLLRAVRTGKLSEQGGVYRIVPEQPEAA